MKRAPTTINSRRTGGADCNDGVPSCVSCEQRNILVPNTNLPLEPLILVRLGVRPSTPGIQVGQPRTHPAGRSEAEHRDGQGNHPHQRKHPRSAPSGDPPGSSCIVISLRLDQDQSCPNLRKRRMPASLAARLRAHGRPTARPGLAPV